MTTTKQQIEKIIELIDAGVAHAKDRDAPGLCIQQTVSKIVDGNRSDQPSCVHPVICAYAIVLNDTQLWDSNQARAEALKRLAICELDSRALDGEKLAARLACNVIQLVVPLAFETWSHLSKDIVSYAKHFGSITQLPTFTRALRAAYSNGLGGIADGDCPILSGLSHLQSDICYEPETAAKRLAQLVITIGRLGAGEDALEAGVQAAVTALEELNAPGCQLWRERF